MKITAIICAGGVGSRANLNKNKLLKEFDGITVLERTLSVFADNDKITNMIVSACVQDFEEISRICSKFKNCIVIEGGESRTQSVANGINACDVDTEILLIHDGARPFVTQKIINDCIESVLKFGSGICSLKATDTFYTREPTTSKLICVDRNNLYSVQTPQGFYFKNIKYAYSKIGNKVYTDDCAVYEEYFGKARLFEGDSSNIKLTYKSDFDKTTQRVGVGIDTHAFGGNEKFITLGGVKIESDSSLIAHSDGDVLIHSLMDAMLSSAGLKDIGHYFPDTDEKWKDANSLEMLAKVNSLIVDEGYKVNNISSAIQAQKPKLAKYIDEMKKNIARVVNVDISDIGISAGTTEGLGYIGREEGITVTSYVSIKRL